MAKTGNMLSNLKMQGNNPARAITALITPAQAAAVLRTKIFLLSFHLCLATRLAIRGAGVPNLKARTTMLNYSLACRMPILHTSKH